MQLYLNPPFADWNDILERPAMDLQQLEAPVAAIMQEVASRGDDALFDLTAKFDKVRLADIRVSQEEVELSTALLNDELKDAIQTAASNIERFHAAQKDQTPVVETMPGVRCWRKSVGIERVGLYVPGGTAPLFSTVLMLAVPARLAGCKEVVLCTPPQKDGSVHPAILYAAQLAGVQQIYRVGGAQAIAAMAHGTASIPACSKIFGPGNAYVTVAKQLAGKIGVAIDMPAGPSEVMVVADETARPEFVAADLLSQAEHGADSQVVLVCYDEVKAKAVIQAVGQQLEQLPRKSFAAESLSNSSAIVIQSDEEAIRLINTYAPEHLILALDEPERLTDGIINAGSVFMGHYTPESVGDYASGTNHTLPTNGFARAYSGVSLDSFVRKITFQQLNKEGIRNIGPTVMTMAEAELLEAHKLAVQVRLEALEGEETPAANTSELTGLVRPNIAALRPYSSARHEFTGKAEVFLDANENPFESGTNRYPDPLAMAVKAQLSIQKEIPTQQIMLANGSDEVIDLLFRIFCEPGQDEVISLPPTYGMYKVSAAINNVKVKEVPLLEGFVPDIEGILAAVTAQTKLLWLCSPNNPSGNDFAEKDIIRLLEAFPGIVVIDEAYVDFAGRASHINLLRRFSRLVIMQTFSKAWGMAGIRMGMAFASTRIIELLNAVKPPYNVNILSQQAALEALQNKAAKEKQVAIILQERQSLSESLNSFSFVKKVYPSDTNFLLAEVDHPGELYTYLSNKGIVVRDRSKQLNCEGCLRFTVGTPEENKQLLQAMVEYGKRGEE